MENIKRLTMSKHKDDFESAYAHDGKVVLCRWQSCTLSLANEYTVVGNHVHCRWQTSTLMFSSPSMRVSQATKYSLLLFIVQNEVYI